MNTIINNKFFDKFKSLSVINPKVIVDKALIKNILKKQKVGDEFVCNITSDDESVLKTLLNAHKELYVYKNEELIGRVYHGSIIQFIPKVLRNTVMFNNFYDLDMQNCHPTLLLQSCNYHNIKCIELEKFVKNRDVILEEHSAGTSREYVKQECLKLFFGGISNLEFLNPLYLEIQDISTKLQELYPDILEFAKINIKARKSSKKYKDNLNPSFLSYFLTTIENRIITIAFHFLKSKKINTGLILHDGIFVSNNVSFEKYNEDIIPELIKYIKNEFYDFDVIFTLKDFSKDILPGAEELIELIKLTDVILEDAFYNFFKNDSLINVNGSFYYCDDNCIWSKINNDGFILNMFKNMDFQNYLLTEYNAILGFNNYKNFKDVFNLLKIDTRFIKKDFSFDENPKLFCFNNSMCIEMDKSNKDIPWTIRKLLPTDYITMTCGYELPDDFDLSNIDNINKYKHIITNMFQSIQSAENYLDFLGTSIYGELLMKNVVISIGAGNNGGSFIASVYERVFGDYFGTFNSSYFLDNGDDGGIRDPEAISNAKKRLITVQEPKTQNGLKQVFLDVSKVKLYTGNDIIPVRLNHSNEINYIVNKALLIIRGNGSLKIPKMDKATSSRLCVISQDTEFVKNESDIIYPYQKLILKDDSMVSSLDFNLCILSLILHYWSKFVINNLDIKLCEDVIYNGEDNKDTIDLFMDKNFPRTTDLSKYVVLTDIYNTYNNLNSSKMNMRSFKQILKSKRYDVKKIDKIINGVRLNRDVVNYVIDCSEDILDYDDNDNMDL